MACCKPWWLLPVLHTHHAGRTQVHTRLVPTTQNLLAVLDESHKFAAVDKTIAKLLQSSLTESIGVTAQMSMASGHKQLSHWVEQMTNSASLPAGCRTTMTNQGPDSWLVTIVSRNMH